MNNAWLSIYILYERGSSIGCVLVQESYGWWRWNWVPPDERNCEYCFKIV